MEIFKLDIDRYGSYVFLERCVVSDPNILALLAEQGYYEFESERSVFYVTKKYVITDHDKNHELRISLEKFLLKEKLTEFVDG